MNRNTARLLVTSLLCLFIVFGLFVGYFATRSYSFSPAQPVAGAGEPVKEIAGYRGWTKVNAEPEFVPKATAALCAPVRPDAKGSDPHSDKYITVYVNDIGRKAMLEQLNPKFPVGSVIVKEKLPDKVSETPELMTVMIKRGKGFNPGSGDWEYMVVDGSGTKVLAQGRLENCEACHTGKPGADYVFRSYLSNGALNKLK
jgi:hypothetical protein